MFLIPLQQQTQGCVVQQFWLLLAWKHWKNALPQCPVLKKNICSSTARASKHHLLSHSPPTQRDTQFLITRNRVPLKSYQSSTTTVCSFSSLSLELPGPPFHADFFPETDKPWNKNQKEKKLSARLTWDSPPGTEKPWKFLKTAEVTWSHISRPPEFPPRLLPRPPPPRAPPWSGQRAARGHLPHQPGAHCLKRKRAPTGMG